MGLQDAKALLKVNLNIEILHGDKEWRTRVEELRPGQVVVADPFPGSAPLELGTPLQVIFGNSRGIFRFDTEVLYRFDRPLPILILKAPTDFWRIQRRRFFRLDVHLPVRFALDPSGNTSDLSELTHEGVTENLSAGGLLLVCRLDIQEGQLLVVRFELPDGPLQLEAVVRQAFGESEGRYRIGLEFLHPVESDRDRIISFLFAEQRQRRQLGLS